MINKCAFKITEFIIHNSDFNNIDDIEKINYALQTILGELFKITTLIVIFYFLGKLDYLLFSMIIFISIRIFVGGYHCKTTMGCLLCSIILFSLTSLISPVLPKLNTLIYFGISLLSFLIVVMFAPFPNIKRPAKSKKRIWNLKIISIFSVIISIYILLFKINDASYLNCGFSTIILEISQIIFVKGVQK
jgi:accessory gene regulator B